MSDLPAILKSAAEPSSPQAWPPQVARQATSIKDFCAAHGIGRTTFYKLRKSGRAPRQMVLCGRMRMISAEAAEAWRLEIEEAARQPAAGGPATIKEHAHAPEGGANEEE